MKEIKKDQRYFAQPANSKVYHIFENGMSLCHKMMIIRPDPEMCDEIKGTETFKKGQDCKKCFKEAKLNIPKNG